MVYRTDVRDMQQLQKSADQLSFRAKDFRLALDESVFRGNLRDALAQLMVQRALVLLDDALELYHDLAKLALGRSGAAGCRV